MAKQKGARDAVRRRTSLPSSPASVGAGEFGDIWAASRTRGSAADTTAPLPDMLARSVTPIVQVQCGCSGTMVD